MERAALIGLALAMIASTVTLLILGSEITFFSDEYDWLPAGPADAPATPLVPHNSHLIVVPRLLYDAIPLLLGPSHLPFTVLSTICVQLCAGLFFVLARRRVGGLIALAPTAVLLFFGSSWNLGLATVGIAALISVTAGLGALVALERGDRRGDVAAAALLILSLASHSFGPLFAIGMAAYLLLQPDRRRRIWVALVPACLYAAWWLWALQFDQGLADASNIPGLPGFAFDNLGATVAALTGLNSRFGLTSTPDTQPTTLLTAFNGALAALALIALAIRLRAGKLTPWFWGLLALLLAFWLAIGLSEDVNRQPGTERYLLPGGLFILLVAVESLRGARIGWPPVVAIFAIAAVSIAGNLTHLLSAGNFLEAHADDVAAQLAMFELAGDEGNPTLVTSAVEPLGAEHLPMSASTYLAFVDRVGSLAVDLDELRDQPDEVRQGADLVLARSYGLLAVPDLEAPPAACEEVASGEGFELESGLHVIRFDGGAPVKLRVGRFADEETAVVGVLSEPGSYALNLPDDSAADSWRGRASAGIELCRSPGLIGAPRQAEIEPHGRAGRLARCNRGGRARICGPSMAGRAG